MSTKEINKRIKQLRAKDPKIGITFNSEQSAISILRGKLAAPVDVVKLKKSPHEHARRFIRENRKLLGDINERKELNYERAITDRRGMTHVLFRQKHGRTEVLGATVSVHYAEDGSAYLLKSSLASAIDAPKKHKITSTRAREIAKKHAGRGAVIFRKMRPVLVVADAKTVHREKAGPRYYLCWKVGIQSPKRGRDPDWVYFIDATRGTVLLRYSAIQTGTCTGHYSTGTAVNSEASGTTYRLRDDVTSSSWTEITKPTIHTYDDAGGTGYTSTNYSEDDDDVWGDTIPTSRVDNQRPEVDIHHFVGYVLDYYYLTHGHNSWDGAGGDAKAHAHNERYSNNAFWSPTYNQLYFADGDGTDYDFMCPLDVVGHEFTHGVNDGLNIVQTYDSETGALNEAIADLFGALIAIDHPVDCPQPWVHGGQYHITGNSRNLADPSRDAAGTVQYDDTNNTTKRASCQNGFYPDHYSIRYTGTSDYHGVHYNSPIISHAVYLMINGGIHRLPSPTGATVTVTGIGVAPVEEMLFYVISTPGQLNNTSEFADFRTAFILACQTLFPENLDYLAAVKTAFHAVGIGPDLYVRDRLADQGEEPGILSCMSPDIILRQTHADAATLAQIGNVNNGSLGQQIELGPDDHYVYFRIFNRGSVATSGTFRLFISPASTFPTPGTWHEVGHYDFPDVPEAGGLWVPTAAGECITLSATLINTLGEGHYCFIGIIESDVDPAPDRMLISNSSEFHAFISKSNNYAWRNCDIIDDVLPDTSGDLPATAHAFQMNGFGRRYEPRDLEIDTRDLPERTQLILWIPATKFWGLKAFEARALPDRIGVPKIAGVIEDLPDDQIRVRRIPLARLAKVREVGGMTPKGMRARELRKWRPLRMAPGKVVRLLGLSLRRDEKMDVRFVVKFPKNMGTRDVTLAFRERVKNGAIGQMNYVFRIRKARR